MGGQTIRSVRIGSVCIGSVRFGSVRSKSLIIQTPLLLHWGGHQETSQIRRNPPFVRPDVRVRRRLPLQSVHPLDQPRRLLLWTRTVSGVCPPSVRQSRALHLPLADDSFRVDHSLPRHRIAVVSCIRLVGSGGQVFQAHPNLSAAPVRIPSCDAVRRWSCPYRGRSAGGVRLGHLLQQSCVVTYSRYPSSLAICP
jgi:hypothetical protein